MAELGLGPTQFLLAATHDVGKKKKKKKGKAVLLARLLSVLQGFF